MAGDVPAATREWVRIVVAENADDLLLYLKRRVDLPEDAADLLGQVLLALWTNPWRVPTGDLDARMWCFGIARNVLRDHHRQKVKQIALADRLREHIQSSPQNENAADTTAWANQRARAIRTAIRTLDEKSRELVMLVHWDGFSLANAARLMSMNPSTARTKHARALQRLETELHYLTAAQSSGARRDKASTS